MESNRKWDIYLGFVMVCGDGLNILHNLANTLAECATLASERAVSTVMVARCGYTRNAVACGSLLRTLILDVLAA